jgi:Domain of unknown function (DUF4383)
MEASALPRQGWTFAQKAIVVLAAIQLLWALAGLIAEPSFGWGADAETERVLGVDFNANHALAGLLLFGPAFYFALDPKWAVYYAIYASGALIISGIWSLFDEQPAWVFTFPNNVADAVLHLTTGAIFAVVAAVQLGQNRSA